MDVSIFAVGAVVGGLDVISGCFVGGFGWLVVGNGGNKDYFCWPGLFGSFDVGCDGCGCYDCCCGSLLVGKGMLVWLPVWLFVCLFVWIGAVGAGETFLSSGPCGFWFKLGNRLKPLS